MASAAVLIIVIIAAIFAPLLAPDANTVNIGAILQGPSMHHLLGTDTTGRDTLSRLVASSRVDMLATLEALAISAGAGIPLGLLAGYAGGWVDIVLSRVGDAILAFPFLILAIGIVGILGPGLTDSMVAVGVVLAPRFFRVARSSALAAAREGYVEAAVADGCTTWRILLRYILPEASGALLVQTTYSIGLIISAEASLGFLGLGVRPPQASWGSMIQQGFSAIRQNAFLVIPPTVTVMIVVAAAFLLGDGLSDAVHHSTGRRS